MFYKKYVNIKLNSLLLISSQIKVNLWLQNILVIFYFIYSNKKKIFNFQFFKLILVSTK